jgi:hypothetical protein
MQGEESVVAHSLVMSSEVETSLIVASEARKETVRDFSTTVEMTKASSFFRYALLRSE